MKTILILICALYAFAFATASAAELLASKFLAGQVTRDVQAGFDRAKAAGKPIVIVTYDPKQKAETVAWGIGGTTGLPETKKLLAEKCVQIFCPWSAKGMEPYRDDQNSRGYPVLIFLGKDGAMVERLECTLNQPDALRRIREILAKPAMQ